MDKIMSKDPDFLICTTEVPQGYKLVKVLGIAWGSEVKAKSAKGSAAATLRGFLGGNVPELQNMAMEARRGSVDKMVQQARKMGANGVVGVSLTGFTFRHDIVEFIAYGTAVIVEKA